MSNKAMELRAEVDRTLSGRILADHDIRRAIERFDESANKSETRRHLLSTSVRLSEALAPDVHGVLRGCQEKLGVETELELFVYPSSDLNAACVRPEDGRVFVMFSSELLEAFDGAELAFVAGHELGHHLFDHHAIPVGALMRTPGAVSPQQALQLFAWSRFAEVSADRAGLYCCGDLDAVARGLFKLASGLRKGAAHIVMEALLAQVDDLRAIGDADADVAVRSDWFSTHPFSPLRLQAARLFHASELMTDGGAPREALERDVSKLMSIMEPGYLKDPSDAAKYMRRLLLAGSMVVAASTGGISDQEVEAMEGFLGDHKVTSRLDPEALRDDLPRRIDAVVESSPPSRRAQVLRDLCVIALADGHADEAERAILVDIAKGLQLDPDIVDVTLHASFDLD